MSRQVDFNTLLCSEKILKINKANMIVAANSNSDSLIIATDVGYPVLLDLRRESIKTFQNPKNTNYSTATSIAINHKSNLIVTGHQDGSISVFSVEDNFRLIATFREYHKQAITAIGFSLKNDDFYVGDISGLTTKISFSKVIANLLTEKEINKGTSPILQILFTKENVQRQVSEAVIIVASDNFILIDPTKSSKERITGRSDLYLTFIYPPKVVLYEGAHGNVDIYVFSGSQCHYFALGNAGILGYSGSTNIYKNPNEITTNAMIWNSKMIALTTNYSVARFINARDIALSIERRIKNYDQSVVQRLQSPLSQAIIGTSVYTMSFNEYLYCISSRSIIKMNYISWNFIVKKYTKDRNWENAFSMILKSSKNKELDAIGISDRISEQNLSTKQLCESVISEYMQYALDSEDKDLINTALRDCVRMASMFSIQKFVISDMLPIIERSDYIKDFYSTVFKNRKKSNDFITPDFIKIFLTYCKKENELDFAEKCLMRINIPKNHANDIASIIYDFGLTAIFTKIMVFSFGDFVTPCIILENDWEKFKTFLLFIYSDDVKSLQRQILQKLRSKSQFSSLSDLEKSISFRRKIKRNKVDWDEIDGRNKFHDGYSDSNSMSFRGSFRKLGQSHDHDHDYDKGYAEIGTTDSEEQEKEKIGNAFLIDPEEKERNQQLKILAQRTICLWLFSPASLLGFFRISKIIRSDINTAVTVLRKCSELLPLRYAPNGDFSISCFADSVMQVLNQEMDGEDIKYDVFLPILDIICPLYAIPEVTITRCALRHTTLWCFNRFEQPQSTRIKVINKIRSKYPTLIKEEDFIEYSIAAGFRFAVEAKYLNEKRYDIIISSMIMNQEDRSNIFEFLHNHKEDLNEIKEAILENIEGLTLIDSESLVKFVLENFPELNEQILSKLKKPINRYLYLRSFFDTNLVLATPYLNEFFELICEFNSSEATLFFQENSTKLDVERAKNACKKFGVSDCFVKIAKASNDQDKAIRSVERAIVDVLETEGIDQIDIKSETQLGQYPPLVKVLNAIDALLEYQREMVQKEGSNNDDDDRMNQLKNLQFLRAFNFPFYIATDKPSSVKMTLFILFSHFIIGSMDYLPVKPLFRALLTQLRQFDFNEIRTILMKLSDQIEFKVRISETILEMFAEDCCRLLDDVYLYTTNGTKTSSNACCSGCLKPLSPPQYQDVLIYPCGHMFHCELECVRETENGKFSKPKQCPICSKGATSNQTLEVQVPSNFKKLGISQINKLTRRLDFALKKNYGSDVEGYRPSSVYFSADARDIATNIFTAQKIKVAKPIAVNIKE